MVPKISNVKVANVLIVIVPTTTQVSTRTTKVTPKTTQMTVMWVVPGQKQVKKSSKKSNVKLQVSGINKHGPSENTQSQTKERRQTSTNAAVTSYEQVVVDAISSESETEDREEKMNQVSDEEIDEVSDDAITSGNDSVTEQWQPKINKSKPFKKGYSPPNYYRDVDMKPFCYHCHEQHTIETIEQIVIGTKWGTTFPTTLQGTLCNALIDTGATKSCTSESYFKTLPN